MTSINPTVNARYGRMVVRWYLAINAVLLVSTCAASWWFAAQANRHGLAPSTTVGFRSPHTLVSLHGWYVAQRVGFHFTTVAVTIITVVVIVTAAVAYVRWKPVWALVAPIVGGIAVVACFFIAGHFADRAAVSVESTVVPSTGSR